MRVAIDRIEAPAIIGIHERERRIPQTLLVDVEFFVDPPSKDRIDAVVNYSSVVQLVREHLREGRFQLIETAAMTTARRIAEAFSLARVRVRVTKPAAASDARSISADFTLSE
ncbi:MAG: dihydroneopterin aldolase [Gammaproteobacteria bacterium]|nr:dihydroneopterin aldolase [Gammaproteobacteria bacterium]